MATYDWPSVLADVLVSDAIVREPGLLGWYSMNRVSEYPTGAAGTTYMSNWTAGVDGWAGYASSSTVAASGGALVCTKIAGTYNYARAIKDLAFGTLKTYRAQITMIKSVTGLILYGTVGGVAGTIIKDYGAVVTGQSVIVDGYAAGGTTRIFINAITTVEDSGDLFSVNQVYVGTGEYAANSLLDTSGNGNHGTICGATPVAGVSGKALSFDNINDYVLLDKTKFATTGAFTVCGWVQGKASRAATQYIAARRHASSNYGIHCLIYSTNRPLFQVSGDGSAITQVTGLAGSEMTNDAFVAFVFIPSVGLYIYKNGELIASNITAIPAAAYYSSTQVLTFGTSYDLATGALDGWLDEVRLYDRALSAPEIAYLYANPSPYAALPSAPLQNGYNEQPASGLLRTDMDAGPAKTRRRYTAVPRYYTLNYHCTANQKQILEDFYNRLLAYGSEAFNWTNPLTGEEVEARFVEPPTFAADQQDFIATVNQEVLP